MKTVILVNCKRGNRGQYFHDWFRSEVFSIQFYFLANAMVSFVMFLGSLRLHCFVVEDCMLPVVKLKFITNKQISYMLEREKPASNEEINILVANYFPNYKLKSNCTLRNDVWNYSARKSRFIL